MPSDTVPVMSIRPADLVQMQNGLQCVQVLARYGVRRAVQCIKLSFERRAHTTHRQLCHKRPGIIEDKTDEAGTRV